MFIFTEVDNANTDLLLLSGEVSFTQADLYGEWQKSLGRKVIKVSVSREGKIVSYFQAVRYPLLFGKNYIYIPYGPVINDRSYEFFAELKKELLRIAKAENAVFVRLDFTPAIEMKDVGVVKKFFKKAPLYTYHSAYFQPRTEWFLELNKTEDELLKEMHEKTRYSIRLSERKGVKAEIVTKDFEKYFEPFSKLMEGTAERNGFSLHGRNYYQAIFKDLSKIPNTYLSVARFGEEILAIDLVIVFGKTAHYVFGGSSNEQRNLMPTYLAQWKAICHAKSVQCKNYNFGGISTETFPYAGWEGLTTFKKKFGGKEVVHSDFFDVIAKPFWYHLYNVRKWIKKLK